MSAETVTRRVFRCDFVQCQLGGNYSDDGEAGKDGWAVVGVNGRLYALCATHKAEVEAKLVLREWS